MKRTVCLIITLAALICSAAAQDTVSVAVSDTSVIALEGTTFTAKRALIRHEADKLVLNVSELAVAKTGTGMDVLKASPGVTVDKDGNIQLNGQGVSVWIDGRPSQMSGKDLESYLKGSPGDMIDKVEIIANPSSKYDAEGSGGIINIRTKKGFMQGLNGSVRLSGGMDFFPRLSGDGSVSANLMYKTDKTNTFFKYSTRYYGYEEDAEERKVYGDDNTSFQKSLSMLGGNSLRHNISIGNDWNISKKDVLGVNFITTISSFPSYTRPGSSVTDYRNYGMDSQSLYSVLNSTINAKDNSERYSGNINYTRTFDESKAQELVINADYMFTKSNKDALQRNIYDRAILDPAASALEDYGFDDHTRRKLDLYSFKADYSQIFWKSTGRIEAGVKAAISVTRNKFRKYDYIYDPGSQSGALSEAASERNDFTYNEQVYAAYMNVSKQFSEKWSAQIGIRGEYTLQIGKWMTENTRKSYFDVFPTAYLSYTHSSKAIFSVNYSHRISRPKYWQMNPFREYINATTYSQGNPALAPSYSHKASFSAVLFSRLNLALGYSHERNFSGLQMPFYDRDTGMMALMFNNAGVLQGAVASVSLSEQPITKWWNITLNAHYNYSWFRLYEGASAGIDGATSSHKGLFFGYFSTTFFLPKAFKLTLDGWGLTSQKVVFYTICPMVSFNFTAEKSFCEGKGNLALTVSDFANTMQQKTYIKSKGIKTYELIQGKGGGLGVSLSFSWKFGKSSLSRRHDGSVEEENRI